MLPRQNGCCRESPVVPLAINRQPKVRQPPASTRVDAKHRFMDNLGRLWPNQ